MKVESSVADDDDLHFDEDIGEAELFEAEPKDTKTRRQSAAEIRRRIEEMMEDKWLRRELGDLDSY